MRTHPVVRSPTGCVRGRGRLLYSARPRPQWARQPRRPVNQEVSDRARRAHRPPREATERPIDGDPPKRRRRDAGDVYPKPQDLSVRGLFRYGPDRLMPATVIVGLQWGDEGKGKTTDFLAEQVAMVVRYQGGDNAGHTVVSGDEVLKLRLVPSGVLYPHITSVIGNGVVVNPVTLIGELDMLASRGIDVSRVRVSRSAHVIMPYHVALDVANEARLDGDKVGHDRAGDRTDLRRPRLAPRPAHGGPARSGGPARADRTPAARQEPAARLDGRRAVRGRRARRRGRRLGRAAARPPRRHDVAGPVGARARRARPARGRAGHAARPRPRQLPVRDLVEPGRGRRLHRRRDRPAPGRRGHRRHEGVLDAGRVRAVPDRAARRDRWRGSPSAATSSGP